MLRQFRPIALAAAFAALAGGAYAQAIQSVPLNRAGAAQAAARLQLQVASSRWVKVEGHDAFEITISARNNSASPMRLPAFNVVLYDAQNRAVGGVLSPASAETVAPGSSNELVLTIADPVPLPAAGGADPLSLMKHVALVVN